MAEAGWLEVSLTVTGELAEAVAEVLARFAPNGVVLESTAIDLAETGKGQASGPMRVYAYLPVDSQLERQRQRLEQSLWHLSQIQPLPQPEYRRIADENWMAAWKENYHPIPVGQRLLICPAGLEPPEPERIAIRIDPGMAFGTGAHPSTQLALALLERYLEPGQRLIDVGCGSGILSIAGIKLGARLALGMDISADAIDNAKYNAKLNNTDKDIEFFSGSLEATQETAPIVVANMLVPLLLKMFATGLAERVQPGGLLLLAGILEEHESALLEALEEHDFRLIERRTIEDWVGLAARRKA